MKPILFLLCFLLCGALFLTACRAPTLPPPPGPTAIAVPSPSAAPIISSPGSSLFSSLPLHNPGESVKQGDYTIQLDHVNIDPVTAQLTFDLKINNDSNAVVDLSWAVQLRDPQGGFISPLTQAQDSPSQPKSLDPTTQITQTWQYAMAQTGNGQIMADAKDYREYRLIFAPKGWSGPITVFRITK
jgi:hypothetical protein